MAIDSLKPHTDIPNCPFCQPPVGQIFFETDLIRAIWDSFPVSPGHALLIPRRHVPDWFLASSREQEELMGAVVQARASIDGHLSRRGSDKPAGYNVGFNAGAAAGQTVFHLHIHIIPRYHGDHPDPRGGIRAVIPGKAAY